MATPVELSADTCASVAPLLGPIGIEETPLTTCVPSFSHRKRKPSWLTLAGLGSLMSSASM